MLTTQDRGSYSRGVVRLAGSFQTNGTGAPTVFRDGRCALIKSVVRVSAGLFTVTLNDIGLFPQRPITEDAYVSVAAGGTAMLANEVNDSYNRATRSFQIVTSTAGTAADPPSGTRVGFTINGSLSIAGIDAQ